MLGLRAVVVELWCVRLAGVFGLDKDVVRIRPGNVDVSSTA